MSAIVERRRLVADIGKKLADAREERMEFVERYERLVERGLLDRARIARLDGQQGDGRDQLAGDLQQADDVRFQPDESSVEIVVHPRNLTCVCAIVKQATP